MVSAGTTSCSVSVRSSKEKKNLREVCEYLSKNRIDKTRILRRVGNVLVVDIEALDLGIKGRAGQQSQKGTVMGYYSCGAAYPPRDKCSGDSKLDAKSKEQTGDTSGIIAQSCVLWRGR